MQCIYGGWGNRSRKKKKKVILWFCQIIQKFLSSDDHTRYADGSQLQWYFMTSSDKDKSHTSTWSVLNLLICNTHLPVYNVQESRTEITSKEENLTFNFLSERFCRVFILFYFLFFLSLATAFYTTRGF